MRREIEKLPGTEFRVIIAIKVGIGRIGIWIYETFVNVDHIIVGVIHVNKWIG